MPKIHHKTAYTPYQAAEAKEIKTINIWDTVYQEYKEYYTKEQIDEMTFAELGELITGLNEETI